MQIKFEELKRIAEEEGIAPDQEVVEQLLAKIQRLPVEVSVVQKWLELDTKKVMRGQVWRLLTCAFLHSPTGVWHIVVNMLLLFWFQKSGAEEERSIAREVPLVRAPLEWSLEQGSGTLRRSGESLPQEHGKLELQPGDRFLVANGSELNLRGPDGLRIAIEVPEVVLPEPRVEYVDKIVERVVHVEVPGAPIFDSDRKFEQTLKLTGAALAQMSEALVAHAELMALEVQPGEILAGTEQPPTVEPRPEPEVRDPLPPRRTRRASVPEFAHEETVVVHREGTRLSLETRGSLDEVVPALIAQIDDADPQVSALVQNHLRQIWSARTGADWNDAPFGEAQEDPIEPTGWKRWGKRPAASQPDRDPVREWTAWWASQETSLAQVGK